jgi:proteic killer suppression protein
MIRSFRDGDSERLFQRNSVRRFQAFERAASLADLKGVGLGLEALTRDRAGQHAIRINGQWRVCFVWKDGDAHDVEIVDNH